MRADYGPADVMAIAMARLLRDGEIVFHGVNSILPMVAIGGITVDNARPLLEAGADLLAVVGGVFDAPDPVAAAREFQALFKTSRP